MGIKATRRHLITGISLSLQQLSTLQKAMSCLFVYTVVRFSSPVSSAWLEVVERFHLKS